ncbi:hypothetical protein [Streptomyces sp. NPDC001816]|uniref:hypothetical protein n=1 Tax=Streptomyces sp. NPDC001816 TaxID=3364612 RepID=UPI0036A455DC
MTPAMEPSDAFDPAAYAAVGLSPAEGRAWWDWRITAPQAAAWRAAGVADALTAAQWATAQVPPGEVARWREAGITATEAIGWHEFTLGLEAAIAYKAQGYTPEQAYDVSRGRKPRPATPETPKAGSGDVILDLMGFDASQAQKETERFISRAGAATDITMYSYLNQEWVDDEAVAWAAHNIHATTARAWKDLGLRPAEASRFIQRGMRPMVVARAWWEAGIPFEEAASWIGAGLTPQEAVAQRESGITVELAETLRALRGGDDCGA